MKENEAKKALERDLQIQIENGALPDGIEALTVAIKVLEEVQQYRQIGTVEECRAAVNKRAVMKPIRMDKCTCPSCGTHNEVWKKRRNTLPSDIVYCWHCGQAVEIFRGEEE